MIQGKIEINNIMQLNCKLIKKKKCREAEESRI
jgi:hypothetical protein